MAIDKAVDSTQLDAKFTAIAGAIRAKTGESGTITPEQMPGKIDEVAEKAVEDFEDYILSQEY